jgi:hypothetical protein
VPMTTGAAGVFIGRHGKTHEAMIGDESLMIVEPPPKVSNTQYSAKSHVIVSSWFILK